MIDIDLLHPRTVESFTTTLATPHRRWSMVILAVVLLIGAAIGAVTVVPSDRQPPVVRAFVRQAQYMTTRLLHAIRP